MDSKDAYTNFIENIDVKKWNKMSREERLAYLQEFENVMAARTGREAVKVVCIDEEFAKENENTLGYYDSDEGVIAVNPKYLTSKITLLGVSQFNMANALATIAHEGRHAWQHYVVRHPEKNLVDRATRLSFQMNFECYQGSSLLYSPQILELDARRYEKEVLTDISNSIIKIKGAPDKTFIAAIRTLFAREVLFLSEVAKNYKYEDFEIIEDLILKRCKEKYPGVDFSGVSMFSDIKQYLKTKNIKEYLEGHSIAVKAEQFKEMTVHAKKVKKPIIREPSDKIGVRAVKKIKV